MGKAEPKKRFHSLYDKIQRMDVLEEAWETVRRNRGSPGIDEMTIKETEKGVEILLNEIQSELKTKAYQTIITETHIHTKNKWETETIKYSQQ